MTLSPTVRLNNGVSMPCFGLGVYKMPPGATTQKAVATALKLGYRLIDTARFYGNEADVGAAVRESGLPRRDIFVTTKLRNPDQGYDTALRAFDHQLEDLGLDDVDLYLIHFPVTDLRRESWRALEKIAASGRARAIGVSNYQLPHLKELLGESKTVPAVNQIELSPFLYQRELIELCQKHGIVVEAYAPLTAGDKIADPRLGAIAKRVGRSNGQVLLRWSLQHDLVPIPKATSEAHLRENLQALDFELTKKDMAALDAMDEGYRSSWDPSGVP
jgi:diketogulonate reductase-like aldo/keto reductase